MTGIRPIRPADFAALASFIGQVNETSGRRDLHTFETPAEALVQEMQDLHGAGGEGSPVPCSPLLSPGCSTIGAYHPPI